MTNCPNCGAPITGHKCEYCGAIIFDFAAIEVGKPVWINLKAGDHWVLAHVLPESIDVHIEPAEETILYADNRIHTVVSSPAPPRITIDFLECETKHGHYHIISERGSVSSTDMTMEVDV